MYNCFLASVELSLILQPMFKSSFKASQSKPYFISTYIVKSYAATQAKEATYNIATYFRYFKYVFLEIQECV